MKFSCLTHKSSVQTYIKGPLKIILVVLGMASFASSFGQADPTVPMKPKMMLTGKTCGLLPYLKYGPGIDRLGGAKMTYLDTAIVVQVIDSLKDDYIIQLSKNHQAFIPKENIVMTPETKIPAYILTGSWKVSGDDKFDYLAIGLDERLPYKSIQLIDPAKIVVDIYGATGNTNWITQLKSAREIKSVSHEQTEDDVFRVTIDLKHSQQWGYSIKYKNRTLIISIKHQPEHLALKHLKIAVDAGHGGTSSGAIGVKTNLEEKIFNLQIARELEKYLRRRGTEVVMTRNADEELSMTDRTIKLREANPDLLISIHHNAAANPAVKGVSTYYRYAGSNALCTSVLDRMLELGLAEFGKIGSFNFSLNGPTEYPNCLVEVAFLSNEDDEKQITDPIFQKNVAKKIRKGIIDWTRKTK